MPKRTFRQLAFIVCTALDNAGETAVLTGGGAATTYAPKAYQTRDLDFVFTLWSAMGSVSEQPLLGLGFERHEGSYRHSLTPYTVEFPAGPLAIGNRIVTEWACLRESGMVLNLLTPTDCVCDRLAWFLFGNDYSALEQAVSVAMVQPINLDQIRSWCSAEGELPKFETFRKRLAVEP